MRKLSTYVISASVLLSACSGMGTRPVLTRAGVADAEVVQGAIDSGPIYNFVQAERRARPYPTGLATEAATEALQNGRNEDSTANREMLEAGFTAVYASCDDFFRSSGRDQTRLLVIRDLIVALSAVAGGVLAVVDGNNEMGGSGNENALSWIALGSTAALSGIDIYTQRFLFGAENIDAVRELTMRALDTHRGAVLAPMPPTTYDRVLVHLMDNQAKCSPRAIARLARDAIAAGRLEPDSRQGSFASQQDRTKDEAALAELGRILDMEEALTAEQAGALWWLLMAEGSLAPSAAEIKDIIAPALAGLPESRRPVAADGTRKPNWTPAESVRQVLGNMSEPTLRGFRLQVAAARQEAADQGESRAIAGPPAFLDASNVSRARPRFRLGTPAEAAVDRRVTVRVVPPD